MPYFDIESFILSLTNKVQGKYKLESRPQENGTLRYKISSSPKDFAFIYFEVYKGEVRVALDFGIPASDQYINDLSTTIQSLIEEETLK